MSNYNIIGKLKHKNLSTASIPSFRYRDNSVHLHEYSPFWVGIFITLKKENYYVYCFM